MGWTGQIATEYKDSGKIDRLAECRKRFSSNPQWATIVKDALVGTVYYAAIKSTETGEIWAAVLLTDIDKNEFFYKDMCETMLPYYYDCPRSILDILSPTENADALEWRKRCYENIATKAKIRKQIKEIEKLNFITIQCPENYNGAYYLPGDIIKLERYYDGRWIDWEKNTAFKTKTIFEMDFKIIG